MKYLIDTCTLSDFFKKVPSVIKRFEEIPPKQIYISSITVMEIEYGLRLNPEREKKIRPIWESLLKLIQMAPYCQRCAEETAQIRAVLKTTGSPVGPFDLLIAGTAIAHQLIMVTSNFDEFKKISVLKVENWRITPVNVYDSIRSL